MINDPSPYMPTAAAVESPADKLENVMRFVRSITPGNIWDSFDLCQEIIGYVDHGYGLPL